MSTLIEKRNQILVDLQKLSAAGYTTESRAQADAMLADIDVLEADIKREERVAQFSATVRPPRAGFGTENAPNVEAEKRSFLSWMRTGQSEQRDLGVGAIAAPITGGGVLVPTGFDPMFHAALKNVGQLADAVGQLTTAGGGPIDVATYNDTTQGLSLIAEAATVTENDPAVAGFQSNTDTATSGLVTISNQLLEDAAFDLSSWTGSVMATRYARGLAKWVAQGNGSNVQALTSAAGASTTVAEGITYSSLVNTYGALDAAYVQNASWVMSTSTRAVLMGVLNNFGQPILQSDVNGVPFNSLFGRPIVISEYADAIVATKKPILFGDLKSAYTLRKVGSYGIKRLNELFALKNETGFVLYTRVGGYNIATGANPVVALSVTAS